MFQTTNQCWFYWIAIEQNPVKGDSRSIGCSVSIEFEKSMNPVLGTSHIPHDSFA